MDNMVTNRVGLGFAPGVDPIETSGTLPAIDPQIGIDNIAGAWWDMSIGNGKDKDTLDEAPMDQGMPISTNEFIVFLILVGIGLYAYKKL